MRKKSVPQKLADKMQIPKDLAYQEPVLTMIGQRELCVENSMEFLFFAGKTIRDDSLPNRKKCIKSNTVICIKSRNRFLCRQVIRYFLIL